MGGTNLHTPPSIFQYMVGQQSTSQEPPGQWMQMPQVSPMSIPWTVPSLQQQEVTKFQESFLHQKRKLDTSDLMDTRQTKQFITEEKMAARFKDLHISTKYDGRPSASASLTAEAQITIPKGLLDLDAAITDQIKSGSRLVLSEELKRIQQEPILPNSLLSKLERPSMALVLWEPPSRHLRMLPTRDTPTPIPGVSDDNNNSNSNNNNNNENVSDLNQTSSSNSSLLEPMEL